MGLRVSQLSHENEHRLTIQVIHLEPIRVLAFIPDRDLDNLSILIPHFCWCLFDDLVDDLWVLFRKPSEQGWDTLDKVSDRSSVYSSSMLSP